MARAIVTTIVRGQVRLWSRNGIEWTQKVPELAAAVAKLKLEHAQLDGEMIVPTDTGSDFNALQGRLSAENKAPLRYMLFDAPQLNGEDLSRLRAHAEGRDRSVAQLHPSTRRGFRSRETRAGLVAL